MLDEIMLRLQRSASHLLAEKPSRKVTGISDAPLGSIEWENVPAPITSWRTKMDDVLDALERTDTGLLVTVDEVDPDLAEMTSLVTSSQHFLDEGRKVALFMAGLPYPLTALLSGKSTSFLRRSARHHLGRLSDSDVEEAFMLTLRKGGKEISHDALLVAVDAISGFPYMMQLVGYRVWNLAGERDEVTEKDVAEAVAIAQKELDERVYDATMFELTDADRAFLVAMLEDDGPTRQSEMASRLNRQSGHVSKYKKRLLRQGVIQQPARGVLEFCLPGFREYLERQV